MEIREEALLQILADHLEVTERLLEQVTPLIAAARLNPDFAIPAFERSPTLQELLVSTRVLRQRVQAILRQ